MKAKKCIRLAAALLALPAVLSSRAAEPESTVPAWIKDHLEIGTRITYFSLRDDKRDPLSGIDGAPGSFYGSINQLDAVQNYLPLKLFVDYKFCPYGGIELTWDRIQADTITQLDGHTDGTIRLTGPIGSIFGRYPNGTRCTPYAGMGVGYFFAQFAENESWHNPRGDFLQLFDLDNAWGWLVYGGLDVRLADHWSADFMIRYISMDVSGTHLQTGIEGGPYFPAGSFTIPMSNTSLGLGVRYSF
jgi:outer membrane protein W